MNLSSFLNKFKLKEVSDPPVVYGEEFEEKEKTEENQDYSYSFESVYKYVLFSSYIDTDRIIGKNIPYYTPESSAQAVYLRTLWNLSMEIIDNKNVFPKNFFEQIEELENLLYDCPYIIKNYNKDYEIAEYERRKEQIVIDFINRSFRDCFRCALELKTVRGRLNHMENWFMKMEYYKQFMNEKEKYVLNSLYVEWSSELRQIAEK